MTDINLSEAQISKITESERSLVLGALTNIAIPLARDSLPGLLSNLNSSAINKFDLKLSWKRAVRAGIGFNLFILNEDMNGIIKIIESLKD